MYCEMILLNFSMYIFAAVRASLVKLELQTHHPVLGDGDNEVLGTPPMLIVVDKHSKTANLSSFILQIRSDSVEK